MGSIRICAIRANLELETGLETSIFRSESSIEAQILDNLALRFSILPSIRRLFGGRKNTDTETAVTFVMNFVSRV